LKSLKKGLIDSSLLSCNRPSCHIVKLLVIEKQGGIQVLLQRRFSEKELSLGTVPLVEAAREKFEQTPYDIVIWDDNAVPPERLKALDSLQKLHKRYPQTQIVILSGSDDPNPLGAQGHFYRWIQRPVEGVALCALIETALQRTPQVKASDLLDPEVRIPIEFEGILAVSLAMRSVIQRIEEAASEDIPVLITGETGTGKDLVAAAIHKRSKRKDFPYLPVNMGSISPELIASELFGHEKGAYTGASEARGGIFEQAQGGSIFLDEITTMDEKTQVSLLRVLETKTLRRVRGDKDIKVDVRVIAATNENLEEVVKEGRFREDLNYRLDVFPIYLPPLRERPGGISFLADRFIADFNAMYGKNICAVSRDTYRLLRRYPWPGNVRELKNVVQRAVLMSKDKELTPDLLPTRIQQYAESSAKENLTQPVMRPGMRLETVEKELITMTLFSVGGNKTKAASMLGISRRAMYNKLKKHGLLLL
jgi:DNA-binding NtrC family response regulator